MRKDFTMELTEHRCGRCGAELEQQSDTRWKCKYCGCTYDDSTAVKNTKNMREMFDEVKMELVNNCRRNLFDAVNAEYISTSDVKGACAELKKYLPDDFRANFYEIAVSHNERKLTSAIRKIDVEENYEDIEYIVKFLIKSLQTGFLLELNNLVERAFKNKDLRLFEKYATEISVQAEKVQMGVYETKLPREVFVAYSSKDMEKVSELVEILESQGLKCFVAARNLRHGKGSVENYDKALKEAIDHCKSFVFVSTMNSRSFSCDALEIEIPYVQKRDTENAPAEYRNNYASIPHKYKKPRVEYRLESSTSFNAADEITKEFFDGYEWVLSPSEVAIRIMKQLVAAATPSAEKETVKSSGAKKYCIGCGAETGVNEKFCSNCGNAEFVSTIGEYVKIKNQRDIEQRRREEAQGASGGSYYGGAGSFTPVTNPGGAKPGAPEKKKGKGGLVAVGAIAAVAVIGGAIALGSGVLNQEPVPEMTKEPEWDYITNPPDYEDPTDEPVEDILKGSWGSVEYELTEDGVLNITGYGDIPALQYMDSKPWYNDHGYGVTALNIAEGITSIGENAFCELERLESVYLPTTVTYVHAGAFANLPRLQKVEAPGVEYIGESAFRGCLELSEVYVGDKLMKVDISAFEDTAFYSKATSSEPLYLGSVLLKVSTETKDIFEIREGTLSVAAGAFNSCYEITNIIIPESVNQIGSYAFNGMSALKTIEYRGSEEAWNQIDFGSGWNESTGGSTEEGYTEIVYCNGATPPSYGDYTSGLHFMWDEAIGGYQVSKYTGAETNVVIPSIYLDQPVKAIANDAFNSRSITDVTIPDSVETISENAFANCNQLVKVKMSNNLKQIGTNAFYCCGMLESISLPDSVEAIGRNAFESTPLYNALTVDRPLYIGNVLIKVSPDATGAIEIKDGTRLVADHALYECAGITNVIIPTSVMRVGKYAFANTYSLETAIYAGTEEEMQRVSFGEGYNENAGINTSIGTTNIVFLNGAYIPSDKEEYTPGLVFAPNSDMTGCIITNYDGNDTVVKIPSIYLGYPVTEIAADAFNNKSVTEVSIPATVNSIGNSAFKSCYSLTAVTVAEGSSLGVIGDYAFSDCQQLQSFEIPASVSSIGEGVFQGCYSLASLTFVNGGAGINTIPKYAFYSSGLQSIDIPDSVEVISESAFAENTNLTQISFGENSRVKLIESRAFAGCVAMTQLYLPKTVVTIGEDSFYECRISSATIPACAIQSVASNSLNSLTVNGGETIPQEAIKSSWEDSMLETLVIEEGIKRIEYRAFYNCVNLKNVTLPNSLETVGQNAFENCRALENIVIPRSVRVISDNAFLDCVSLFSISLPESLDSIGRSAFEGCTLLRIINIPNSVTSIGSYAFYNCTSLVSVDIPEGVTKIPSNTFRNSGIESVFLHSNIESIGSNAFGYCEKLRNVELAPSITNIDANAFEGTLFIETVSASADAIAKMDKSHLVSVTVTGGDISSYAFSGCTTLREFKMYDGLEMIGDEAFANCVSLLSIEIPESVNAIAPNAFVGCHKIAEIINHTSLDVASLIDGELVNHTGESLLKHVGDYTFITAGSKHYLIDYIGEEEEISLPSNYEGLGYTVRKYAFENNNVIKKVTVSGANEIEKYAFYWCSNLVNLTLGDSVTNIQEYAFANCNAMESVTFGKNLEAIGKYAFEGCNSLKKITLPLSLREIGIGAFSNCTSLGMVTFTGGGKFQLYDSEGTLQSNVVTASSNGSDNAELLKSRCVDYRWERIG